MLPDTWTNAMPYLGDNKYMIQLLTLKVLVDNN